MSDMIRKDYRYELKGVDEKENMVEVVVSTGAVDRDREIVDPDAMRRGIKEYKKRPILLSNHRWDSIQNQIGEAKSIKIDERGNTVAKFKYYVDEGNAEADWAYKLALKGVAAYSIGFLVKQTEDMNPDKTGAHRKITDLELVEVSQVTVPSNRGAIQARRDAEGVDATEKELCELALKSIEFEPETANKVEENAKEEAEIAEIVSEIKEENVVANITEITVDDLKAAIRDAIKELEFKTIIKSALKDIVEQKMYDGLLTGRKLEPKAPVVSSEAEKIDSVMLAKTIKEKLTLRK